jgi:hypothetical protein
MKRYALWLFLLALALTGLTHCSSSKSTPPPPPPPAISVSISQAPPGTMTVNTTAPVTASVSNDSANGGVNWSCTPAGACGSFNPTKTASGTATTYTAPAAAANVSILATSVTDSSKASSPANVTVEDASVTISQAPPAQMAALSTAPVTATVTNDTANAGVNWTCMPAGSCGSFNPTQTASGTATTYTAPASPTNVTIVATSVTDPTASANANTTVVANYSFYLSGQETGELFYAVAGSVTIDPSGNVVAGEQDYNDGSGIASPQPSGDSITGGTLTVDGTTGQGTLTLVTNNASVGSAGTETLGVQFINNNHAQIIEYDSFATSSGSMDLQTLPSALDGGWAFALTGVSTGFQSGRRIVQNTEVNGGVFTISSGNLTNGAVDANNGGTVTMGTAFTGIVSAADSFGRGTITGTGIATTLNYYVIGPEAMRIIDVDAGTSAVGSAFGQGAAAGNFSGASLTNCVFEVASNSLGFIYGADGMILPSAAAPGAFTGVGDVNEEGVIAAASPISGTYTIGSDGYGGLTITNAGLEDVSVLGIYMTDPNLNLSDPNNNGSGLGGALVADLDTAVAGTGYLVPQTDTTSTNMAGNYAFGGQVFDGGGVPTTGWEVDFLGQGTINVGSLVATGIANDPFLTLSSNAEDTSVTYSGNLTPDNTNHGRYLMFPPNDFDATLEAVGSFHETVAVYEAYAGQLVWLAEGTTAVFTGSLDQQAITSLPALREGAPKTAIKTAQKQKP